MIFDAVFALIKAALSGIASLLPTWTPVDLATPVADFMGRLGPGWAFLRWLNWYLPIKEGLVVVGLGLTLFGALQGWKLVLYLGVKLHLLGGTV